MGSGGGEQKTTTTSQTGLPSWEQTPAKAMVATLMNYIYPGSTVPENWFSSTKGFSFPTGGGPSDTLTGTGAPGATGGSTATQGGGPVTGSLGQLDPFFAQMADPVTNALLGGMVMGSPFLRGLSPNTLTAAMSAPAAKQMGSLYKNQSGGQSGGGGG